MTQSDFASLLTDHLPALLRYGTALTGNPHDGADLVQTVCEKAGARWSKIANGDPMVYLKVSMANARVSAWRRRRRETLIGSSSDQAAAGRSAASVQPTSVDAYPSESAHLWRAVAALPRGQRAVIVLRYVEGHSEAEIAAMLNISPGAVKSQASRAMTALRTRVARDTEAGDAR